MKRILMRSKRWYVAHRERARVAALQARFDWLESECRASDEPELAMLLSMVWEMRASGELDKGIMCLVFRRYLNFGPLEPGSGSKPQRKAS